MARTGRKSSGAVSRGRGKPRKAAGRDGAGSTSAPTRSEPKRTEADAGGASQSEPPSAIRGEREGSGGHSGGTREATRLSVVHFDDYVAWPDEPAMTTLRMSASNADLELMDGGIRVTRNDRTTHIPMHMVRQWWEADR